MAILDIENNELSALAEHSGGAEQYATFLGIGMGKSRAKKTAGQVAALEQANSAWADKMNYVYKVIKGNEEQTNKAKKTIGNKDNWSNIFLAVQDFGSPTTKKNIADHNAGVDAYIKYDYANLPTADCNTLMKLVDTIDTDVEAANKAQSAGKGNATSVAALGKIQSKIKKYLIEQECEKKQEEVEQAKAKEETLGSLSAATKIAGTSNNTLKYVAWGVGGLVVLISVVMLIRKR